MTLSTILLQAVPAAAAAEKPLLEIKTPEDLFLAVILCCLVAVCAVVAVATWSLYLNVKKLSQPAGAVEAVEEPKTFWQSLTGLVPLAKEKDLKMDHEYDGIAELDNPTPPWFMYLFYSTIAFAVVYLIGYHMTGTGKLQIQEYTEEVAVAEKAREEYLAKVAGSINENTVTFVRETAALESGKTLFNQYCTACHGQNAEGKVGPNLTDEYWLHGGDVKAVFHTITEGVPEKGMVAWKKQLNPLQVQQVTSYILSLQGSKPVGAKEPQGEKVDMQLALK